MNKRCNICLERKDIDQFYDCRMYKSPYCKPCHKRKATEARWNLKKFGLTKKTYEQMLHEQNGVCKICQGKNNGRNFCVDHCHRTGIVRGLLCFKCNSVLGFMDDDVFKLQMAINYIIHSKTEFVVRPKNKIEKNEK